MNAKLTDGRTIELQPDDINPFGQIHLSNLVERGVAEDEDIMCKLLGADPCDIRYGMVHPGTGILF